MKLEACELCPRRCGRRPGFCGAGLSPRVFRWGPHFGEEPPITGERGSGCVFFSRCTMKCVYCQNSPWSWGGEGRDISVEELVGILRDMATKDRVDNWNLVSPTPYLPFVREAVASLRREGVSLPVVWNSSGYERVETLEEYSDLCDWALFDLRYANDATAQRYSSAPGYVAAARAALKWAWEKRGPGNGERGTGGLVVRILVLPGHADEAIESLAWIASELSSEVPVSVMSQYTPAYRAASLPPLDRTVTKEEYDSVAAAAADFGFVNGWVQGMEAADPKLALLGENMTEGYGAVANNML